MRPWPMWSAAFAAGQSKGFCYVNYSTREAAALAMDTLNGVEWPPASGVRLKVCMSACC